MPRASDKTKPITIYPSRAMTERIEEFASKQKRSASGQVVLWLEERPELKEVAGVE